MATTTTRTPVAADTTTTTSTERSATETARDIADTVRGATSDAANRLPAAAATTRDALVDASRTLQSESSERLSAGTLLSFGFALGLLIGGANRLLVLLALIPATAMGVTLLDRNWRLQGRR